MIIVNNKMYKNSNINSCLLINNTSSTKGIVLVTRYKKQTILYTNIKTVVLHIRLYANCFYTKIMGVRPSDYDSLCVMPEQQRAT